MFRSVGEYLRLRRPRDLHLEFLMATQTINLGFPMTFVADRAGDIAQMGLVGISVLKFFRF